MLDSYWLTPLNENVAKQKTQWICVCDYCQQERIVSYAQSWNIKTGKNCRRCRQCQVLLGQLKYDTKGLSLGRKYHKRENKKVNKKKKLSKILQYRNLFENPTLDPECRKKQRDAKLGKYGELSNAYIDGSSKVNKLLRSRDDYKQLRLQVFKRDNFTCQLCLKRGGKLELDHIKEWCNYPELRYELTNCRTLCNPCHKQTPNYGPKAKRNK